MSERDSRQIFKCLIIVMINAQPNVLCMTLYPESLIFVVVLGFYYLSIEPRSEKTGLRGFRPGPTQTGLCSYRGYLEA